MVSYMVCIPSVGAKLWIVTGVSLGLFGLKAPIFFQPSDPLLIHNQTPMKRGDTITIVSVEYKHNMTICTVVDEAGNKYVGIDTADPKKAIQNAIDEEMEAWEASGMEIPILKNKDKHRLRGYFCEDLDQCITCRKIKILERDRRI